MKDRMDLLSLDLERQYNGDGDGILCQIETVASAPTYDVRYPYNINGGGPGTMLLIEGMEVACINPSGGAERDRAVIESVDTANEQITLSASLSSAAIGDYLVLCNDVDATGTDQANNYQAEANGILAAIAEGDTFLGIDGSSVRRWNANVISSSGAITEKKIATLEARVRAASGKRAKLHYTTRGISIELQDQLAGLRRFSGEQTTLKGGYEGVNIGGRDVLEGDFCPKGYYFVICTSADEVGMLDLVKRGFIDLDGAELHRIEGRHAYRADLWFPHNAIWFSRNAHGALTGLDDDNTIVR